MARAGDLLEGVLLALIGYVGFSFYLVVGRLAGLRGLDLTPLLHTVFDDMIPFIPAFFIPYIVAYAAPVPVAFAIARHGGLHAIRRTFFVYFGMVLLHFGLYLILPVSAASLFVSETAMPPGRLSALVAWYYRLAPPWNAWPSLHVAGGWFFYRALAYWVPGKFWTRVYLVWFWLMFFSTFAIKIHWIGDALAGLALAEALYRWALVPMEQKNACSWTWPSEPLRVAAHLAVLVGAAAGLAWALK